MRGTAGFTLLEVMIVVGLASLVAALATVALVEVARSVRLAGAVRAVAAGLRAARGLAIRGEAPVEVRFAAQACETRDGAGVLRETRALPGGVAFTGLPSRGHVTFGGLGTAENATVTLAAGTRTRRVIVNQRGRVRVR